ncbi:MAG TPA: HAD hydrolase-like protein [Streptosporangiaceae bacterium]|nr:HAD hydrolase-like protein [Streptosporangiaceae bacterium]
MSPRVSLAGPVGFDLDLTLIDSQPAILAAWAEVARETGVAIDPDSVIRRLGIKLEDEAAYWFPPGELDVAAAAYRRHYLRVGPQLTTSLPGAAAALAAVRQAGEQAVIITAKHPVSVGPSLTAAGLEADDLYTHVYGPEKAAVLSRIGAAVYVGDAPADMSAAAAAGARAVGVATGSSGAAGLVAAGADVVLDSLLEFPPWYAATRGRVTG